MNQSISKRKPLPMLHVVALLLTTSLFLGAKKKEAASTDKDSKPADAHVSLPADLNQASLRVAAIDMIYQLDLSTTQLHQLHAAADGAASHQQRTAAKADAKLGTALSELAAALLDSKDDTHIAELRNQVVELASAESSQLDDEVQPTDKAKKAAPEIILHWTASQIAAYLAFHADQVTDPAERMVGALTELHDSSAAGAAETTHTISTDIAHTIVGFDTAKAGPLAEKIADWLKSNHDLKDEEIATRQTSLEESARKVIGDVPPMDVLNHWLEDEAAMLLANPQTPDAIDAVIAAKEQPTAPN